MTITPWHYKKEDARAPSKRLSRLGALQKIRKDIKTRRAQRKIVTSVLKPTPKPSLAAIVLHQGPRPRRLPFCDFKSHFESRLQTFCRLCTSCSIKFLRARVSGVSQVDRRHWKTT